MVEPQRIAAVLGGPKALGRRVRSVRELAEAVEQGLPKVALRNAAARILPDAVERRQLIYRIIPEATYKRRRDRLSPAESERTERLARVIATAEYVWDEPLDTHRFLTAPHPQLGGKTPIAAALTELGARQVEQILEKILFGLPA
jgi:putative toxin-antitoxin system antitoxin component (TIGR02293 family)